MKKHMFMLFKLKEINDILADKMLRVNNYSQVPKMYIC